MKQPRPSNTPILLMLLVCLMVARLGPVWAQTPSPTPTASPSAPAPPAPESETGVPLAPAPLSTPTPPAEGTPLAPVEVEPEVPENAPPEGVRGRSGQWQDVQVLDVLERHRQELELRRLEAEARFAEQRATLQRFGMAFFARSTEELSQTEEASAPDDYQLAPGDEVEASFVNVKGGATTESLLVDESGMANFSSLGPVSLGGLTRAQAESRLNSALDSSRLRNLRARLRILKLQKIRVFVLGEATRPGGFLVNPGSTMLDALLRAGGPNEHGSFRRVGLQRNGRQVAGFDLYDLLIRGNVASPRLRNGDRVFVPLAGQEVSVLGEVKRPAIYELKNEATLKAVVELAGGVRPDAYSPRVRIERVAGNRQRELVDVALSDKQVKIRPGDVVVVHSVLDEVANGVYLDGAVKRPGWYQLVAGMKVADLLRAAQGLKQGAHPGQAEIFRREAPEAPVRMLGFDLGRALVNDPENNLLLRPDDVVVVYAAEEARHDLGRVRIQGQVTRPGEYPRHQNMRVRDLLLLAGGVTPEASGRAEIARPEPEGRLRFLAVDLMAVLDSPQAADNFQLADGDALVVREGLRARPWPASVRLAGEFKHPGVYSVDPTHEDLQSLIERAGGLTEEAYLPAAVFTRERPEVVGPERERISKEILASIQEVAAQYAAAEAARQASSTNAFRKALQVDLQGLSNDTATIAPRLLETILRTGRIPIDLQEVITTSEGDPGLADGDVIYVPTKPRTVTVVGAVNLPSPVIWRKNQSAQDYIGRAGGLTKDAEEDEVMVLKVNGELHRGDHESDIGPGDLIIVPNKAIVAEPDAFDRFLSALQTIANGAFVYRSLR